MSRVSEFSATLSRYCEPQGIYVKQWRGSSRHTQNMMEVGNTGKRVLLYVKEYNRPTIGFWGINENQLRSLRSSGRLWFVVLLKCSADSGYLLADKEVESGIREGVWSRSALHFKLHENDEIVSRALSFKNLAELATNLTL